MARQRADDDVSPVALDPVEARDALEIDERVMAGQAQLQASAASVWPPARRRASLALCEELGRIGERSGAMIRKSSYMAILLHSCRCGSMPP